eukprot:1373107-Amphidinium_carterae.1
MNSIECACSAHLLMKLVAPSLALENRLTPHVVPKDTEVDKQRDFRFIATLVTWSSNTFHCNGATRALLLVNVKREVVQQFWGGSPRLDRVCAY